MVVVAWNYLSKVRSQRHLQAAVIPMIGLIRSEVRSNQRAKMRHKYLRWTKTRGQCALCHWTGVLRKPSMEAYLIQSGDKG